MVKALIVGVSEYSIARGNLPLCKKDIYAMKEALTLGLAVKKDNITLLGENRIVNADDFVITLKGIVNDIGTSDTFILYFSGHGAKINNENYLVFSDKLVSIKDLVSIIDNIPCKNKIVMLDCCHAGNKEIGLNCQIDINETADQFVGHGCAILASCDIDETSGFDFNRDMSRYTCILYDALSNPFLIRQGKKSLEDIKQHIDRQADIINKSLKDKQHNAFRSSIVGTVYFDVEEYKPYKSAKIYKETNRYIIYSVEPVHANVKRISLKVILRSPCSVEEIANIAKEINQEALYYEVYNNEISENRWRGKPNNIIFAYYGYDDEDMVNGSFAFRSVWVDKNQDKGRWYNTFNNPQIINDICVEESQGYLFGKRFITENTSDDESLINQTRSCMVKMIVAAQRFIGNYRELINKTITEDAFISKTKDLSAEIRNLYLEQSNLPIASKDLHDWSTAYDLLSGTIDDLRIPYNPTSNRDSKNRKQLMDITIKRYNECLEKVKELDAKLADSIDI